VEKQNKVTFVDYNFVRDGQDIIFDKELTMESMQFYEGKTFKVTNTSEGIMLKFVGEKYEDKESTTH